MLCALPARITIKEAISYEARQLDALAGTAAKRQRLAAVIVSQRCCAMVGPSSDEIYHAPARWLPPVGAPHAKLQQPTGKLHAERDAWAGHYHPLIHKALGKTDCNTLFGFTVLDGDNLLYDFLFLSLFKYRSIAETTSCDGVFANGTISAIMLRRPLVPRKSSRMLREIYDAIVVGALPGVSLISYQIEWVVADGDLGRAIIKGQSTLVYTLPKDLPPKPSQHHVSNIAAMVDEELSGDDHDDGDQMLGIDLGAELANIMATDLDPEPPDDLHSGAAVAREELDDAGHDGPGPTCDEEPVQADLSLKRIALAIAALWKAEFAASREAMDLHLKSSCAIRPHQRPLSLVRSVYKDEQELPHTKVCFVHWVWPPTHSPKPNDVDFMVGREVNIRDSHVVYSMEALQPKRSFRHDAVLIADCGVCMVKAKTNSLRPQMPQPILRLQTMFAGGCGVFHTEKCDWCDAAGPGCIQLQTDAAGISM